MNFEVCIHDLISHVLPQRAYSEQKRYMQHFIKKPRDCSAQEFVTRLFEINQYLDQFLPFNANQKLPTDELLDIAGYAILVPWQHTMHLHAFDPLAHNKDEFIEFCQRCEFIDWPPQTQSESNNDGNGRARAQGCVEQYDSANQKCLAKCKNPEALEDGKPKWCEYHQSTKHNMGACWDVLNQVAAMCHGFNPHRSTTDQPFEKHQVSFHPTTTFKPVTSSKKTAREEQHWIESLVDGYLDVKVSDETKNEATNLDELTDLHINNDDKEVNSNNGESDTDSE